MDNNVYIKQILFPIISSGQLLPNPAQSQDVHALGLFFCTSKSPDRIANYLPTMKSAVLACHKVKTMQISPSSAISLKSLYGLTFFYNTTTL